VTKFVEYLRGVRQGACESPRPCFLTYIDDIFETISQAYGVEIPHISSGVDVNDWIKKMNGLSFADDTVAVSHGIAAMQNVAMGLGRFADVNFMSYNTKKCATLVIEKPKDKYLPSTVIRNPTVAFAVRNRLNLNSTDDSDTTVSSDSEDDWVAGRAELLRRRKMPTMTHRIVLDADDSDEEGENGHTLNPRSATYKLRSQPIVLNGQKVPIGEHYEYLGLGFNNNFDLNIFLSTVQLRVCDRLGQLVKSLARRSLQLKFVCFA
jgi:hypothetical protein